MSPAHPPHPENSTAGLVLLDAEHDVVATGEEHHQGALSRFAQRADGRPRQVVVALHPAPVTRGRHAGQPGVEVLLDGQRVGELTHRMAQRYGPLIRQVLLTGGRPGCRARIARGRRGLEVVLRLPVITDRAGAAAPTWPAPRPPRSRRPAEPSPLGPQPPARPGGRPRHRKPLWIGAGVGAALLIIGGSIGSIDDAAAPIGPVSAAAASTSATATPTSPTPTPTPTATSTAALPTVEDTAPPRVPPPPPTRPSTARPAPETSARARSTPDPDRTTTRKPTAKASSGSGGGCSPNYSGCVPIASDVDCAGGSGNGPKYVSGPLRVTGSDVYDLDRDGNGVACE